MFRFDCRCRLLFSSFQRQIVVDCCVLIFGTLKVSMNSIMFCREFIFKLNLLTVLESRLILPSEKEVRFSIESKKKRSLLSRTSKFVELFFLFKVLQLKRSTAEQQYINVGNSNDYSLIYKPMSDVPSSNTSLIIDISRATNRISLEEKFRLERRSNHYLCKMSKFNETTEEGFLFFSSRFVFFIQMKDDHSLKYFYVCH